MRHHGEKTHRAAAIVWRSGAGIVVSMLFLIGIGLALAIALAWQLAAKRDTDPSFFVPRFVIACIGVLVAGMALIGIYILIVIDNLGGW